MRWRGAIVAGLLASLAVGPGCAKQPPLVTPEAPGPLEVPVPPPRVLAPSQPVEAPPAVPEEEPRVEPPRPARPRQPARTPAAPGDMRPDPAKPEVAPTEGAAAPSGEGTRPETPASGLRTPQTANDGEADRRVRDVLARATRALEAINRAQLSSDARAQFDTARRFIDQSSDALTARNYMFARYLADKAEALAKGLAGR